MGIHQDAADVRPAPKGHENPKATKVRPDPPAAEGLEDQYDPDGAKR